MIVTNGFVCDAVDRSANEAGNIAKYNKRPTMDECALPVRPEPGGSRRALQAR